MFDWLIMFEPNFSTKKPSSICFSTIGSSSSSLHRGSLAKSRYGMILLLRWWACCSDSLVLIRADQNDLDKFRSSSEPSKEVEEICRGSRSISEGMPIFSISTVFLFYSYMCLPRAISLGLVTVGASDAIYILILKSIGN